MQINSRIFGNIDVAEDKILHFEKGLIGFEDYKKFTLLYDAEKGNKNSIMWLQSIDEPQLAFPVADPLNLCDEYNPVVEDDWLDAIGGIDNPDDLYVLAVMTVPSDLTKVTANLKAPVIINVNTRKGCQIIVGNDEYQVRYNVYDYICKIKEES